ncbi:PQQ-binding-like beta-propeller repeat protein [Schumannella luteola]
MVVGTLLIVGVDEIPQPDADLTHAESFLPEEGSARLAVYEDGAEWVIETAYGIGSPYLVQQPPASGEHQLNFLESIGLDVAQQRFWRQTWTDVVGERTQLTEIYHLTQSGVRAMILSGGDLGFSYSPGIIVLPSDVHDGSTWEGEGDAWPQQLLQYRYTGSARAGDDGCIVTELDVDYLDPAQAGAVVLATTEEATWCPGRGVVESSFTNDGVAGSMSVVELGDRRVEGATEASWDFSDGEQWSEASVPLLVRDRTFGESPLTASTDGTAAATSSGVTVFNLGRDLSAYARADDGQFVRQWIAHPGGEVVGLTAIGDVVLVATTDRRLQAYDDHGRRAWSSEFGDLVSAAPVSDGAGGAIVVALDGTVRRLDLATGAETWSTALGGDSDISAAVAGGRVFTVDRSNTWSALDLATGEPLWSQEFEGGALVIAGPGAVVAADDFGGVVARDPESGAVLWRQGLPGVVSGGTMLGERAVLQSTQGTYAYDASGTVEWSDTATDGLVSDGERLVLLGSDALSLVDSDGSAIASWDVDAETLAVSHALIAVTGGVWVVNSLFEVEAVTAP